MRAPAKTEMAHELHNRLAGAVVGSIVKPIYESGGTPADVYVLLESVCAGVIDTLGRLTGEKGGDPALVDALSDGVKGRLADLQASRARDMN